MSFVINKGDFILIPTERQYSEYFISGTGYLCCNKPHKMVISENPLIDYGVSSSEQIEDVIEENGEYFVKLRVIK